MRPLKHQHGMAVILEVVLVGTVLLLAAAATYQTLHARQTRTSQPSPAASPVSTATPRPSSAPTPTPTPSNLVTDYFAAAGVSFTHPNTWTFNTAEEAAGSFYAHPNEKAAQLTLPYPVPGGPTSQYTITLTADSVPLATDAGYNTFQQLGQLSLGGKPLYIEEETNLVSGKVAYTLLLTSGCPHSDCEFTLPGTATYFGVRVTKGLQTIAPLDTSMVPGLVTILQSLRLGH